MIRTFTTTIKLEDGNKTVHEHTTIERAVLALDPAIIASNAMRSSFNAITRFGAACDGPYRLRELHMIVTEN